MYFLTFWGGFIESTFLESLIQFSLSAFCLGLTGISDTHFVYLTLHCHEEDLKAQWRV